MDEESIQFLDQQAGKDPTPKLYAHFITRNQGLHEEANKNHIKS
jgi:hypothetical protein